MPLDDQSTWALLRQLDDPQHTEFAYGYDHDAARAYDEEEERVLFHTGDRLDVEEELEAPGYIAIPEHLLWTRYDGVSDLVSYYPPERPPTWWVRFIDYL
ncbi:hypothetical protein ACFY8B_24945 [Streptomyces sp. NPDC012751]|uniref:hypothetical protein n=1 Tax=Streptomyces sp. NPDC012751 TaxID=3364846 RepID=UPI0036A4C27C